MPLPNCFPEKGLRYKFGGQQALRVRHHPSRFEADRLPLGTTGWLHSDEIHIWFMRFETVSNQFLLPEHSPLSDAELCKVSRFRFARDRQSYFWAHVLARTMLAHFSGAAAEAISFESAPFGKPFINRPEGARKLNFNLSHTAGFVACALSRNRRVGVDVERISNCKPELACEVFTRSEARNLAETAPLQRASAFCRLWTLKEALVKALGCGLSMPFDSFEIDLSTHRLLTASRGVGNPAHWHFASMHADADAILSVATNDVHVSRARFIFTEFDRPNVGGQRINPRGEEDVFCGTSKIHRPHGGFRGH